MKKGRKQLKNNTEQKQDELSFIRDQPSATNEQPLPQPKDYDEIEY